MFGFLARIPLVNRLPGIGGGNGPSKPEPSTSFDRFAEFIARHARAILVAAGIFFVVGAIVGGSVFKVLLPFGFDDPASESIIARDQLSKAGGVNSEPGIVVLIKDKESAQSAEALATVAKAEKTVAAEKDIGRTASIATPENPKATGALPGMISNDGKSTYVLGFFKDGVPDDVKQDTAHELEDELDKLGPNVSLGGIAVAYAQINEQVEHDLQFAEILVFPLLFLLSFWVFRGLIAAGLPPLTGALSIVGSLLGLRIAAELTDLSVFAVNLITAIGLGLSIDYSLFVVSRFREELARPRANRTVALKRTMRTAGRTVLFSSLTVAGALASLLIFPQRFLYSMGVGGTLVALLAGFVALTVLPAVLWLLGKRVNSGAPKSLQRRAEDAAKPATEGFWYRLSRIVMRRPAPIAIGAAAVMLLIGLPFLRVVWTFADARVLPHEASARQVSRQVDNRFPPSRSDPIQIQVGKKATLPQLEHYTAQISELNHVDKVAPPRPVGTRGVKEVDVFYTGDHFSDANQQLVRDIRDLDPPFVAHVGGTPARFIDQNKSLISHMPAMLAIIAVVTLTVLFLMTGSVILPIKALIMNLLTISAAFGILVLVFQDGRFETLLAYEGFGGIDSSNALLLFAVAFGLSTDYGVFLLTRIKEAYDSGMSNEESVAVGMERTGRLITAAALLLCVAVLGFATSKIIFIKEFSIGAAAAVALDATIVRGLLVPSLMMLLGKWNWWAPKPLRRVYERFGIAEA